MQIQIPETMYQGIVDSLEEAAQSLAKTSVHLLALAGEMQYLLAEAKASPQKPTESPVLDNNPPLSPPTSER